jgi:hypothetical protein
VVENQQVGSDYFFTRAGTEFRIYQLSTKQSTMSATAIDHIVNRELGYVGKTSITDGLLRYKEVPPVNANLSSGTSE